MRELASSWEAFQKLLQKLAREGRALIANRSGASYIALRAALEDRSVLVISEEDRAESLSEDFRALSSVFEKFRDWSVGFVPPQSVKEKNALLEGARESKGIVWFAGKESVLEPSLSKSEYEAARLELKVGKTLPYQKFINHLSEQLYQRVPFVEDTCEFSARGEVLDFWSPNYPSPARLIFYGDTIESLHFFDPGEQRTREFVPKVTVVPCRQAALSGKLFDHLREGTIVINFTDAAVPEKFPTFSVAPGGADLGIQPAPPVRLNWGILRKELSENRQAGIANIVFCRNTGEAQRLEDHLESQRMKEDRPAVLIGPLNEGFKSAGAKVSVWSFREIVGGSPLPRRLPRIVRGRILDSISEIVSGDFVVHENFGIGRYRGLERMSFKKVETEFLNLEFRGGDKLFVPIQDFRLVQKYVGAEGKRPPLSSLDQAVWERTKDRVRKEVAELARELLKTAASREAVRRPGGSLSFDGFSVDHLMKEFEEAFPYEETPDQEEAIRKVMSDLESPKLMDHLVCGDVGYGKTEIAMRAAFRAACESKQVAVLVPTTILAEQHFKTFEGRFAAFPIKIAMLSRFQSKAEQVRILEDLKAGAVDILIGTHRLIQKDVHFKNLGLVVIDEEHRFGVKQKEAFKRLKVNTDVLALSATPIPRTLSLAMGGIRNVSVVESPPAGRLPIETHVGLFDEKLLKEAIKRELARGGQVFYVHNRIPTIETRKRSLEKLFPKIRVGIAHGQMSAEPLESAMWNFLQRKWDILLSTTIIESGLDIPNVNTLIVEDTEEFGLAQLYQLRGRVGRQRQKAYCLLFFSDWAKLSEDARKRLTAIQEFSELGSGMKLALRDMEIRGTGNLLGPQQHGWIAAVGLDLYCQLLNEEVTKIREEGAEPEAGEEEFSPEIELGVSAFLPDTYVELPGERIALYKKMIAASFEDLIKIRAELQDRFGPLPEAVENLINVMALRLEAKRQGVSAVTRTPAGFILSWIKKGGDIPLDWGSLAREHPNLIEILPPEPSRNGKEALRVLFKEENGGVFEQARKFLQLGSSYASIGRYAKK